MKVFSLLLLCALISATYGGSIVSILGVCLTTPCDLSNPPAGILSGALTVDTTLSISTTALLTTTSYTFSKSVNLAGIAIGGTAGVTLSFAAGTASSITGSINATTGSVVTVAGTLSTGAMNTFDGAIVTITGAATFSGGATFQNTNGASASQQGLTVASGATLNIGASSSIDASTAVNFAANSIVNIKAGTTTIAQSITASGNVTVTSALTLSNAAAVYTQSQGNFALGAANSATLTGSAVISSAAAIRGEGIITGSLTVNGGIVATGNSPGTVIVRGDLNLDSSSTVQFDVASDQSFDKLLVTGNAKINGILVCHIENGYNPKSGTQYTLITTGGTTSGSFTVTRGDSNIANLFNWKSTASNKDVVATYSSAATATASFLLIAVALVYSAL